MDNRKIISDILTTFLDKTISIGVRLIISAVLIFVSFKLINLLSKRIENSGKTGKLDKTLAKTFAYALRLGLKGIVIVCMIGFMGIDTSGFAALLVSLGAGIGLALNGAISNFAGGILIILTRPFRVDDFIEAQSYSGTVEDIHIITTKIRTPDNKVVYIPNGPLSSESIVNYSVNDTRRVDLNFIIGYNDDFEHAKSLIIDICREHMLVFDDPAPTVRVCKHGQSGIELVVRAWVKSEDYWTVSYDITEAVKLRFDKAGVVIPYNQIDVHIKNS